MDSDKASREPYPTSHLRAMAQELRSLNGDEQRRLHMVMEEMQRAERGQPGQPFDKPDPPTANQVLVGSSRGGGGGGMGGQPLSSSTHVFPRPGHSIGWAVKQLWNGNRVTRAGWNGPGQRLGLQVPDANSANTLPYVYIVTVQGHRVPWLASQTDLLATDWILA